MTRAGAAEISMREGRSRRNYVPLRLFTGEVAHISA